MRKYLFLLIGFILAATTSSRADTNKEILVKAPEIPKRSLLNEPSQPSAALEISESEIDSTDIERQDAATLTEALDYMPSALTETRGRMVKQFTSFRGQIYPYPDYSINGIWQGQFRELPYFYPASQIGRIEVLRSSGAIMKGLSDIEGVINIVPRTFEEETTLGEVEFGTHNFLRSALTHGDSSTNGSYTLGINYQKTDGPEDRNAAERIGSLSGYGEWQATPKLSLEGQFFILDGQRELMLPDPDGKATPEFMNRVEEYDPFNAFSVSMRALYKPDDTKSTELTGFYTERSFHYERRLLMPTQAIHRDYEYGVQLMQTLELSDRNTLRFGGLYNHWVAPRGKRFYYGSRQDQETISGVIVDEYSNDRLTLDAGLRLSRTYNNRFGGISFNISGQKRTFEPVVNEWDDPILTGTLGAKYALNESLTLYSHLAAGERNPEAGAVTADGSAPDTEKRLMLDTGIKLERENLGFLKLGGFYTLRNDAILKTSQTVTNAAGDIFNLSDNSNMRQYGLELELRSERLYDLASLFFNATLMESRQKDNGNYTDYIQIPDQMISGGLYADKNGFDFNIFAKYVSGYENDRFVSSYVDLGDYLNLNATLGYTFGENDDTRAYLSFKNILNDDYSTVPGWSNDGNQIFAGLTHRF